MDKICLLFVLCIMGVVMFVLIWRRCGDNVNVRLRMGEYNVLFGLWGTPEDIGRMFKPYNIDVLCFNEVPNDDWTERVGRVIGLEHIYVGEHSSGNHKNKYKSILSRYPLYNKKEIVVVSDGWHSSVVSATIKVKGIPIRILSTHIPGANRMQGSASNFIATSVIKHNENTFLLGDLNNTLRDGVLDCFGDNGMISNWDALGMDVTNMSTCKDLENDDGVIDHIFFKGSPTTGIRVVRGGIILDAYNDGNVDKEMSENDNSCCASAIERKRTWYGLGKPLSDHLPIWTEFIINIH